MATDTIASQTLSVRKEHQFLVALEKAGLSDDLAQRVIESKDNELAVKVVHLIQNGGFEPTTSQKRAREIMGKNFFGVEEAIKHFGVNPTRQQTAALSEVPFSEEVLTTCKETHVLVAVFPISILEMRGRVDRKLFYSHEDAWYNKQAFAKDKGETSWALVRKTPVENSTSKTWPEQQAILSKDEETPIARVMVYTIIGHHLATGERLFAKSTYVRCSDVDSDGRRVVVGSVDSDGLFVNDVWDDDRYDLLGVSSARKSN